jgi:hypothetical protein
MVQSGVSVRQENLRVRGDLDISIRTGGAPLFQSQTVTNLSAQYA